MPYRHYARKNLGFLFAISNGARIIYGTDDDNELIDGLERFDLTEHVEPPVTWELVSPHLQLSANESSTRNVCNPYAVFGQPSVWPRGYPLQNMAAPPCTRFRKAPVQSLIQQGLANGDPGTLFCPPFRTFPLTLARRRRHLPAHAQRRPQGHPHRVQRSHPACRLPLRHVLALQFAEHSLPLRRASAHLHPLYDDLPRLRHLARLLGAKTALGGASPEVRLNRINLTSSRADRRSAHLYRAERQPVPQCA